MQLERVCQFPWAAITNCHKLVALKHPSCILSQFWRPGVENQCRWAEVKCGQGWFRCGAPGENRVLSFPAPRGLLSCSRSGKKGPCPLRDAGTFKTVTAAGAATSPVCLLHTPHRTGVCSLWPRLQAVGSLRAGRGSVASRTAALWASCLSLQLRATAPCPSEASLDTS